MRDKHDARNREDIKRMMTFKELVLLISPFIIIGGLVWFHVFGCADFLKWYRDRSKEDGNVDINIVSRKLIHKQSTKEIDI